MQLKIDLIILIILIILVYFKCEVCGRRINKSLDIYFTHTSYMFRGPSAPILREITTDET